MEEEEVQGDLTIPADVRTMGEFIKMGSTINPDIQLTGDCLSQNKPGMILALHVQLWVDGGKVQYQHYRKPMANSLVMMKCFGLSDKTITQEGIRILRNTSLELPEEVAAENLTELCASMKAAGYDENL